MLLGPWRSGFLQFDHDHVIGSARRRHQPAIVDRMHGMAQCVLALFSFQKKIAQYQSHQIFGLVYEVLNAVEKNN